MTNLYLNSLTFVSNNNASFGSTVRGSITSVNTVQATKHSALWSLITVMIQAFSSLIATSKFTSSNGGVDGI